MTTAYQNFTNMGAQHGFSVTTTSKFKQNSDGTNALLQGTALVDPAAPTTALGLVASPLYVNSNPLTAVGSKYVTCAASTTTALGTGAVGDFLGDLLIVPGVAAAGIVQIKDGALSAITVFAGGGTTALPSLVPFTVPIMAVSTSGGWSVITNANVTGIATGKFTP